MGDKTLGTRVKDLGVLTGVQYPKGYHSINSKIGDDNRENDLAQIMELGMASKYVLNLYCGVVAYDNSSFSFPNPREQRWARKYLLRGSTSMPRSTRSTPTPTPSADATAPVPESPASPLSGFNPNPSRASPTFVDSATPLEDRTHLEVEVARLMVQHILDLLQFHALLLLSEHCELLHGASEVGGSGGSACRSEEGAELQEQGSSRPEWLRWSSPQMQRPQSELGLVVRAPQLE